MYVYIYIYIYIGYVHTFLAVMTSFCLSYIIIFYISWLKGVVEMRALDTQLDSENLTPSDYAIQLTGLPTEEIDEDEFLYKICGHTTQNSRVARGVFVYDLKDHIKINAKLSKLKKIRQLIINYRKAYAKYIEKKGGVVNEEELNMVYPPGENICVFCWKSIYIYIYIY